jgi:precorrin-2 dehydrogenase / sirohydrochlorin ferrochelatase
MEESGRPSPAGVRPAIAVVPVGLRVEGKTVLVVGAGRIAARKAETYASQGARLIVVAPDHSAEMEAVNVDRRVRRPFVPSDLDGVWFVVTATGSPTVDGAVYRAAEARRVWCNAADDPDHCSVVLPAVVRRGDLTATISSGGRSPAVASWLRRRIDPLLDDDTLAVFEIAARVRAELQSNGQPTEVPGWSEVLDRDALSLVAGGRREELERRLSAAVGLGAVTHTKVDQ